MKKIYNILLGLTVFFVLYSCTEKVLVMPEATSNENPLDNTRPPLRPDEVSVYADFYHTLEIVFPEQQPDRVVKAEIEWDRTPGSWEKIEVTNFDEDIRLENLQLREYTFRVIYLTAENLASKTVVIKQTPLEELYKYIENIKLEGKDGLIVVDWKNDTEREVRIDVRYSVGGQEQVASKLSDKGLDTLIIDDLEKGNYDFHVSVFDPVKEVRSSEVMTTADPGETVPTLVLATLRVPSFAPAKYAGVIFENISEIIPVTVKVDYLKDDDTPASKLYEDVLNQKIVDLLSDVKLGSSLEITVTDSKGSKAKTEIISTIGVTGTELDRTGWIPSASSYRSLTALASQLLDGEYGTGNENSTNGWVSAWGSPILNPDGLGKSSNAFPHYIQVDMQTIKCVTGVSFINHGNSTQNGPGQFIVQYSFDGNEFYDGQTMQRATNAGRNARTHHYLDNPLLARYIRIHIISGDNGNPSNGVTRIAEFYVYGVE